MTSMNKEQVEQELHVWRKEIETFFRQLEEWAMASGRKDVNCHWSEISRIRDSLMEQFEVGVFKMPALSIMWGPHRISFIPTEFFSSGTRGVMNVVVSRGALYYLVNRYNREKERYEWILSVSEDPRKRDVLTQDRYVALMTEAEKALEASRCGQHTA